MDIVGKVSMAPGKKVFLLIVTDHFSKWVEAKKQDNRSPDQKIYVDPRDHSIRDPRKSSLTTDPNSPAMTS